MSWSCIHNEAGHYTRSFLEVSSTSKTDSQRTEHFQLATDKIAEPNRNIKMVYKKKNTNKPIFYSTKIGTVLVNQRCCVLLFSESLSIHRPTSRKPWREKKCEGQTDRQKEQQGHGNRDVTVITHPASRGFDGRMWNSSDNPHRNHRLWCILLVVNEP